jgi:hypothetical protein
MGYIDLNIHLHGFGGTTTVELLQDDTVAKDERGLGHV